MARSFAGGIGRKAAFAAALGWLLTGAAPRAEDAKVLPAAPRVEDAKVFPTAPHVEDANVPPAPPPMSPPCDVPGTDIAAPATLPNITQALQKGEKVQILAIGSSSTSGWGASSKNKTYPSQLEVILEHALKGVDVVIVNRGVAGEVAETTAERIKSEVALKRPDLVLWQLGTNDALARIPQRDFEETVRSTLRWLKDNKIDVVLVGLQYTSRLARDPNYVAIRDSLQKIAATENILYVRRYDAMRFIAQTRANLQLMAGDNFHLNDLGYQCMAEHVAHAMIVSLFAKRARSLHN
jgi:acyl-CoA thioesterase I